MNPLILIGTLLIATGIIQETTKKQADSPTEKKNEKQNDKSDEEYRDPTQPPVLNNKGKPNSLEQAQEK